MPFPVKVWKNLPDRSTPTDAAALIDLETRLSGYTDIEVQALLTAPVHDMAIDEGVETMPRHMMALDKVLVSQTIKLAYFKPHQSYSVDTFRAYSGNTVSATITLGRFGLYEVESNGTLTLVARSANDTTLFDGANEEFTGAFATAGGYPASYNIQRGVYYAAAILMVGTTMPTIWGSGSGPAIAYGRTPTLVQAVPGQSDLPASILPGSLDDESFLPYVAVTS